MAETIEQFKDDSKDSKPENVSNFSILSERICSNIQDDLPHYIGSIPEFEDCSIKYLQQYRVIFLTPEGLGIDMDRQQHDVNYFQVGEQDIAKTYDELEIEYITERKAKRYNTYGITGLFKHVWSDLWEKVGRTY